MLARERLELGDDSARPLKRQVSGQPVGRGSEPQIVQPSDRRGSERGVCAVRQRRPAPEGQSAPQHRLGSRRVASAQRGRAVRSQPLELVHIHVTGVGQ